MSAEESQQTMIEQPPPDVGGDVVGDDVIGDVVGDVIGGGGDDQGKPSNVVVVEESATTTTPPTMTSLSDGVQQDPHTNLKDNTNDKNTNANPNASDSNDNDNNNSNEHPQLLVEEPSANSPPTTVTSPQPTPQPTTTTIAPWIINLEYMRLCSNPISGIYILPSNDNPLQWNGLIIVSNMKSPFAGAFCPFTILFPQNYPFSCPSLFVPDKSCLQIHPWISPQNGLLHLPSVLQNEWNHMHHSAVTLLKVLVLVCNSYDARPPHTTTTSFLLKAMKLTNSSIEMAKSLWKEQKLEVLGWQEGEISVLETELELKLWSVLQQVGDKEQQQDGNSILEMLKNEAIELANIKEQFGVVEVDGDDGANQNQVSS